MTASCSTRERRSATRVPSARSAWNRLARAWKITSIFTCCALSSTGRKPRTGTCPAARRALEEAGRLVPIPNAGGRYSTKILPDPDAVYRVRQAVAEAIEALAAAVSAVSFLLP